MRASRALFATTAILVALLALVLAWAALPAVRQVHAHNAAATTPAPRSTSKANAQRYCDEFLKELESRLGKSQDELRSALLGALDKTTTDAQARGDLTRDQARKLHDKVAGANCDQLGALSRPHTAPGSPGGAAVSQYRDLVVASAAGALHATPADLEQAIASGQTLHPVADARGITQEAFLSAFKDALKTNAAGLVGEGKITQKQADMAVDFMAGAAVAMWDRPLKQAMLQGMSGASR